MRPHLATLNLPKDVGEMSEECIFCKIASGEVPSDMLYRDKQVFAIRDIRPQAPKHLLILPVEHIPSIADVTHSQAPLIVRMITVANELAAKEGIAERGYRLAINCRREGGQAVPHLHIHLLGGKQLSGRLG